MISRNQAIDLLHSKMQSQNLRRHCYAVEAAMRGLAKYFRDAGGGGPHFAEASRGKQASGQENGKGINEEIWGVVGLLHDGDYEFTKTDPANHAKLMADWVRELGETDTTLLTGIESHGWFHQGRLPETQMQWSLFCCDELTGLIVATALVQPSKKLADVTVEKVLKKFPEKNFAAGVKREDVKMCEEKLGVPLAEFVGIVLTSMHGIADKLGL